MKKILPLLFVFVLVGSCKQHNNSPQSPKDGNSKSQTCSDYVLTHIDKITGDTSVTTKNILVSDDNNKTGLSLFFMKLKNNSGSDPTILLAITAVGASNCIDKGSKINILFTDSSKMEFKNMKEFNCENSVSLFLGSEIGNKPLRDEIAAKKIAAMRVWTKSGYVQQDFTQENSDDFNSSLNCILEYKIK